MLIVSILALQFQHAVNIFHCGFKIPRDLITKSFEGGLEDLKFDEESVGLWNFLQGDSNYVGEGQR